MTSIPAVDVLISRVFQTSPHDALLLVVTHYNDTLRRYCWSLVGGNRQKVEDLRSDVFLKLAKSGHTYRGDCRFTTWLFVVVRSVWVSLQRKSITTMSLDRIEAPQCTGTNAESLAVDAEVAAAIPKAINQLSLPHQIVIRRFYFDGQSTAQIASDLAIPQGTVKSRLANARTHLRKLLRNLSC